jgi:hypothetical protein
MLAKVELLLAAPEPGLTILDNSHLVVSCVFGPEFKWAYAAPPGYRNVFFSNNPAIEEHVREQGWNFALVKQFPLSDDVMISSLQAKWVKFLQFLGAPSGIHDVRAVTYFDHKFKVLPYHIEWAREQCTSAFDLLIRETPREKLSISDEIGDAMHQERYVRHMPETLAFLDDLEKSGHITRAVRIVNTGLIHYRNLPTCCAFVQDVYDTCIRLSQPECQIVWAALSQLTFARIKKVPWKCLEPSWMTPSAEVIDQTEMNIDR